MPKKSDKPKLLTTSKMTESEKRKVYNARYRVKIRKAVAEYKKKHC